MNDQDAFNEGAKLRVLDRELKSVSQLFSDKKEEAGRRKLALLLLAEQQGDYGPNGKTTIDQFLNDNSSINQYILQKASQKKQSLTSSQGVQERIVPPFFHKKINPRDLHKENKKLLTEKQIQQAKDWFAQNPTAKHYPQKSSGFPYSVMLSGGQCYAVYKEIKSGAFGKVKLVQNQETGGLAIRKTMDIDAADERSLLSGRKEQINLMDMAQSMGEMSVRKAEERSKKNQTPREGREKGGGDQIVLTMELALGEDGYEHFVKNGPALRTVSSAAEALQAGLNFLVDYKTRYQDRGMISRDLKPDNAIFDEITYRWTFVDAGPAIHESEAGSITEFTGTPGFMAPEVNPKIKGSSPSKYTRKADTYSLGASLVEIWGLKKNTGSYSVEIKNIEESKGNAYFRDKTLRGEIITHLKLMTADDPNKRPTLEESMKFFQEKLEKFPEIIKTRRVAIFDIEEYKNASSQEKKNMLAALREADEVWMLDRSNPSRSDEDIGVLQADLQAHGIRVSLNVFTAPDCTVKTGIEGIVELNGAKKDMTVRGLYFVTNETNLSLDQHKIHVVKADTQNEKELEKRYSGSLVSVSPQKINEIKIALGKELTRLENKYGSNCAKDKTRIAKERYDAISKYKNELKEPINFVKMENELMALAKEMTPTGRFMSVSTGAKNMSNLNESLEKNYKQEVKSLTLGKI